MLTFLAESQGDARQETKLAFGEDTLGEAHCSSNCIARRVNSQKWSPNPLLEAPPGPTFNTSSWALYSNLSDRGRGQSLGKP